MKQQEVVQGDPHMEEVTNYEDKGYSDCIEEMDDGVTFSLKVALFIAVSVGILLGALSFAGVVASGIWSIAVFSLILAIGGFGAGLLFRKSAFWEPGYEFETLKEVN